MKRWQNVQRGDIKCIALVARNGDIKWTKNGARGDDNWQHKAYQSWPHKTNLTFDITLFFDWKRLTLKDEIYLCWQQVYLGGQISEASIPIIENPSDTSGYWQSVIQARATLCRCFCLIKQQLGKNDLWCKRKDFPDAASGHAESRLHQQVIVVQAWVLLQSVWKKKQKEGHMCEQSCCAAGPIWRRWEQVGTGALFLISVVPNLTTNQPTRDRKAPGLSFLIQSPKHEVWEPAYYCIPKLVIDMLTAHRVLTDGQNRHFLLKSGPESVNVTFMVWAQTY